MASDLFGEIVAPSCTPISSAASTIAARGGIAPSRWARAVNDAYMTVDSPWIVPALLGCVEIEGPVLEPACGVGHMVVELRRAGLVARAWDLYAYDGALVDDIEIADLRDLESLAGFRWAITNLPYRDQDELAALLVRLGARDGCGVALLARSEWIVARRRRALIHECPTFAGMVQLTRRPKWSASDLAAPRHNFSWVVWDRARAKGMDPWIRFG
jgi:hypothetical protein